jgi:hypothetical protein
MEGTMVDLPIVVVFCFGIALIFAYMFWSSDPDDGGRDFPFPIFPTASEVCGFILCALAVCCAILFWATSRATFAP